MRGLNVEPPGLSATPREVTERDSTDVRQARCARDRRGARARVAVRHASGEGSLRI